MDDLIPFPAAGAAGGPPVLDLKTQKPWFSLAVICGNEEHHIARFLGAFAPWVDEIILVRAIGNAPPDRTFEVALAAMAEIKTPKPISFHEYRNEPGLDWPHVDNFSRARQMSYDLAQGEFIMWADCDDIVTEEGGQRLRGAVDLGNFDVMLLHYQCKGSHSLLRERVIRRGTGRWTGAVHEAISLPPAGKFKGLVYPEIQIFHWPLGNNQGKPKEGESLERNLRILRHSVGPSIMAFFYLHRDSLLSGKFEEALDWGKLAVAHPGLTVAERYRVYFNLANLFLSRRDFMQAELFAQNGLRLCPDRRECFCLMAISYMEQRDFAKALLWIQHAQCITVPPKHQRPNWFEEEWYGWRCDSTHSFILRKLKQQAAAEAVDDVEHGGNPIISLLHATRGRAQKAVEARDMWFSTAMKPGNIEHIYAIDSDDAESLAELEGFRHVVVEPGGGCVRAWNAAAAKARGKVLIQMSDDWIPPYHWDNLIMWPLSEPITKKLPAVLAISDGTRKDQLLCMAILTAAQYRRQRHEKTGEPYLFHPDYLGVFSDNEFTVRAYDEGVVIEAKDIIFLHQHPVFGSAEMDATYAAQNSAERYAHGLAVFNRRNPRRKIEMAVLEEK